VVQLSCGKLREYKNIILYTGIKTKTAIIQGMISLLNFEAANAHPLLDFNDKGVK
jgi:hypothetical protein